MKRNHDYIKVWKEAFGEIPRDENGVSYEIHHKDGDWRNNDLSNLECITIEEHYKRHFDAGEFYACALIKRRMEMSEEERKLLSEKISEANRRKPNPMSSLASRQKLSESLRGKYVGEKHHGFGKKRPEHSELMKSKGFGKNKTEEHRRKQAQSWKESTKENPIRACNWKIGNNGEVVLVRNLKKFCVENSIGYLKFYRTKQWENFTLIGKETSNGS